MAELAGADLFEIKPENPYSTDYQACVDEARKELQEHARPKLAAKVADIRKSAAGAEVSDAVNGNDLSDDRIKEWLGL